jgi:hypothetical protein
MEGSVSSAVAWLLAACLVGSISARAEALDFHCPAAPDRSCKAKLYLSGEIVAGDYERFREELRARGPDLRIVQLWSSPGGNLDEAMKIGRLIRKLWIETRLAHWISPRIAVMGVRWDGDKSAITVTPDNAVCASACAFIWVAGVPRSGNAQLIIHRPYFDPKHFAGLDASEATQRFNQLQEEARAYLAEMNVGPDMWETMKSIPSNRGLELDKFYLAQNVAELVPAMEEWTAAKCGRLSEKEEILREVAIEKADHERTRADETIIERGDEIMFCGWEAVEESHAKAWNEEFDWMDVPN